MPGGEQRAAGRLGQDPGAAETIARPVRVGRGAGPAQVRADRERRARRVPRQPLAAGGLAERAAEPAELRRQRDVQQSPAPASLAMSAATAPG